MKDGQIIEEGTHYDLMAYIDGEYSNLIKTFHNNTKEKADCKNDRENKKQTMQDGDTEKHASKEKNAKVSNKENDDERAPSKQKTSTDFDSIDSSPSSLGSKLTTKENISEDKVRLSTVTSYVKAAGGAGITSLVVFLLVLYSGLQSFENYWISYWIEDGSGVKFC
ncbi:hypothetical protein EB796_002983 [Bugula neritina]|uniref:Uncharacterized protein n=1 Tax=Bugula neritina TaxID=10212 RepID=A0A7J7KKD2_BUGNE|nr:hypothetical protein EB796_002983 [Bugula neritina]